MFLVSDGRDKRQRTIARFAADDIAVGVVLAAIDFEWTCRRCILALGIKPTMQMKRQFVDEKWFGCELKDAWDAEVYKTNKNRYIGLDKVFDEWAPENCERYVAWQDVVSALKFRNKLVHGAAGSIGVTKGRTCINIFEVANDVLCEYLKKVAGDDDATIFKRIYRDAPKSAKAKHDEICFAGARQDELMIEGVRVKRARIESIAKRAVKAGMARKIFMAMRPLFKEW